LGHVVGEPQTKNEVGRLSGRKRRRDLLRKSRLRFKAEFDRLAAVLLEGGDDLADRLIFLG
jgi:hypothetical protein